jgi:LPS-assembly protein
MLPAPPKDLTVSNSGAITYDPAGGVITFNGDVSVRSDTGLQFFANQAVLNSQAKSITLLGNVSIYQGNILHRGQSAEYFYATRELKVTGLRSSIDPLLLETSEFVSEQRDGEQVFVGHDAGLTTDDSEDPSYWLRAKKITVYPNDKVVFNNLRVYAGDTPVFWLPYLSQPLDAALGYHFVPGARSSWGAYLLNTYGIMLGGERDPLTGESKDAWLLSKWHMDLRSRRGAAAGLDLIDTRLADNPNLGWLKLYYMKDANPSISRSAITRLPVDNNRWSIALQDLFPLAVPGDPSGTWEARANLTALSDQYYLEDLDPSGFRVNPNPDNTLALYRRDERSLASLFSRFQLNDFYRSDTRLPELTFDQVLAPLFGGRLLHLGQTSAGIYQERLSDSEVDDLRGEIATLQPLDPKIPGLLEQLDEPAFTRFHTYQELSVPFTYAGWLALNPHAGLGYTAYQDISGPLDSEDRTLLHAGVDASVKFSRAYPDIQLPRWGVDGMLHVMQPYLGWSTVSTDGPDDSLRPIDRFTFSTRPRSIRVGSFAAIDELQTWNVLRPGIRNKLITRRDDGSHEWLVLDTYLDAFVDDPELDRDFSNFYNDLKWAPLPWLRWDVETQFPLYGSGSGFREFATRGTIMPNENAEITLGYRILSSHPVLEDNNRIDLRGYLRLNDRWGIGTTQIWELDDNTLEFQQFSVHRDLNSWVASLGLSRRDNRGREELGILLSLTLKDFPDASLPLMLESE